MTIDTIQNNLTHSIIKMDSKLTRNNDIIFSDMDGETVMMSIDNGEYYGINPIGSRIWNALETPHTPSEIIDMLLPHFDVTREQCLKDVIPFLERMVEKGIIKSV